MNEDPFYLGCETLFGRRLLRFLLAIADQPSALTVEQRKALEHLMSLDTTLPQIDPRLPVALVRLRENDLPVAWTLRLQSGGDLPELRGESTAERLLAAIARDCYPVLLMDADATVPLGPWRSLPAAPPATALAHVVDSHPLTPALNEELLVLADTARDSIVASALDVRPLRDGYDGEVLLAAAARRLRHDPAAGPGAFMAHAVDCLTELELQRARRPMRVRALVAFNGIGPVDPPLRLPQGLLRAVTEGERRYAPLGFEADAVLEAEVEVNVVDPGGDTLSPQAAGQERLGSLGRELCLAAALAARPRPPVSAPAVAWATELGPAGGESTSRPSHPATRFGTASEPFAGRETLAEAARRVAEADLSHVSIAVERILRALWEPEWSESVVDAVVAWENLVGTSLETTFRVTAALSVLCEDDPARRPALRKKLARAYSVRSKLVHGDVSSKPIAPAREVAVGAALEALERLIAVRPDLLALPGSEARAERLLLGLRPPAELHDV